MFTGVALANIANYTGQNPITERYDGCPTLLEPIARGLLPEKNPASIHLSFNDKDVQAEVVGRFVVSDIELPVLKLPKQSFIYRQAEGHHKMQSFSASFEGYYFFVPDGNKASLGIDDALTQSFAQVRVGRSKFGLKKGQLGYLVGLDQRERLEALMSDFNPWKLPTPPDERVQAYGVPSSGVIQTPQGTIYRFEPSGKISVYPRAGEIQEVPPEDVLSIDPATFASHLEIARRQGNAVNPGQSDILQSIRDLTWKAIRTNERKVDEYRATHPGDEQKFNELRRKLGALAARYEISGSAMKPYVIGKAIELADELSPFLPPELRWSDVGASVWKSAPSSDGKVEVRIIRSCVILRKGESFGLKIRVLSSPDVYHAQVLHSQLGNFGLKLADEGAVAGAHLAFTYEAHTRKLKDISLEASGMVPLTKGYRPKILKEEIESLRAELDRAKAKLIKR